MTDNTIDKSNQQLIDILNRLEKVLLSIEKNQNANASKIDCAVFNNTRIVQLPKEGGYEIKSLFPIKGKE